MATIEGKQTDFGFEWGAATVERLFSDDQEGFVTIGVKSSTTELQICITKRGKIRVHQVGGTEWKPEKTRKE